MNAIVFKGYLLRKLTNWIFLFVIVISAVVSLKFNLNTDRDIKMLGVLIAVGFLIIFYFNRTEPKLIKFNREDIEITYFSNPPYGKGKKIYPKNVINATIENDKIILLENGNIVAKIRKKAVDDKDWETLENYFG